MNQSDKNRICRDPPGPGPDVPTTCFKRPPYVSKRSVVTVQPVMSLTNLCWTMSTTQCLSDCISEDVGYNMSRTSNCSNASQPSDPLEQVASLTAQWNLYINLGGLSCFSYVADISDKKSRTFKIAILDACLGASGLLAGIIGGEWICAQGYIKPYCFILAVNLASTVYVYLFIHEAITPDPGARLFSFRHYKSIWHLFFPGGGDTGEGQRLHSCRLCLYILSMLIAVMAHACGSSLYVLHELSSPLCRGAVLIGYGSAALNLANLTSVLDLKLMQLCLKESWIALIGLVSFAFATTTALMFTGYALFLYMVTTPVLRAMMSRMVDPSQQGALFAALGCLESVGILMGTSISSTLYPANINPQSFLSMNSN